MTGTFVVDDVECMLCMHVSCHLSVTFRHIRWTYLVILLMFT